MDRQLVQFFKQHQLPLKNKTLVVAVSTGVDSMALLHACLSIRSEYNLHLYVAHFNHQKREQSTIEAAFIKAYSEEQEIGCIIERLPKGESKNFQSYARDQRYTFFERTVKKVGADYLLLAHHATDNMETILMRMIRGSNLKAYAGMEEVTKYHNIMLLRPFLRFTKDEIIEYAQMHKIKYYQDVSNFEDIYTRNRIRKEIIPALFREDEHVHLKFQEFSETLLAANELLEEKVAEFQKLIAYEDKACWFKIADFKRLSLFLQYETLFSLLKQYQLGKANISEIIKLINSRKQNIKLYYKGLFTFVKEYDKIYFFAGKIETPQFDVLIEGPGVYRLSDKITVSVIKKTLVDIPNLDEIWYNTNMLPLRLRNRRDGDKILLEAGYKKVKDLLIDQKVGILKREQVIICEKDQEVLAVLGVRKSVLLKQHTEKNIVIKVEYKNG
ncbi:MAG: tRNA lysidine(34) synthetase TilS [Acholeplasmataceae bacterium]|nr:tRNA lysidine(34) synthetase TilS [Acholeplasmataceae bacterium]